MHHGGPTSRRGVDGIMDKLYQDLTERLLPRRELRRVVPVSDMTIWRWERDGLFPRHVSINGRNYWRLSEISHWMEKQERASASDSPGHLVR